MKNILLLAALLLPASLPAQESPLQPLQPTLQRRVRHVEQSASDTLADNYRITLTITDKDAQPVEVSVVVASSQFSTSLGEQNLGLSGNLTVEESGSVLVSYTLGWQTAVTESNSTQYRSSNTQGSVRLKLGEEVQIIRAGSRIARLTIKKLEPVQPK